MFNCQFSLWSWDEDSLVDEQVEMPKCPSRHDVLQWFAREPTHEHRIERGHHRCRWYFVERRGEFHTVKTACVLAQPSRLVRVGKANRGVRKDVAPRDVLGHHTELACANCSI